MNPLPWIKQKFFRDWFPHWSPDAALRYLPIVDDIRNQDDINTILDVGSGSLGITPYLKKSVTGIDQDFTGPNSLFLHRVKGTALKLPLNDNSFDASICVDVLEHIPKKFRRRVINELIRVAKKRIYIVAPCEKHSEKEDRVIFEYIKGKNRVSDPFLSEHIKYGLPNEEEILSFIPKENLVQIKPLTNLYLHRLILMAQFSGSRAGRFISSVIFVLLIPFFLNINFSPSYRKFFIIKRKTSNI